ncbi:MAG: DUF222 domain-containing protein, partial [Acidimicrobiia bacterium]|nr:DUF222 domain-containing protein [Acidimicrobiia bacterium]
PDSVVGDAAVAVGSELSRLRWAHQALIGAWELSGEWCTGGARSVADEYTRRSGVTPQAARRLARLARRLRDMAATSAAWQAGDITDEAAERLARLRTGRAAELFDRDEHILVGAARTLDGESFERAARHWESCAEDELSDTNPTEREQRDHQRRSVTWTSDRHGNTEIIARLEAVGGTAVIAEIERIEQQLFETDWADARAIHGDDTTAAHLQRTASQRRADALRLMAERSAAAQPNAATAPLISVLVDLATFTRATNLRNQRTTNTPTSNPATPTNTSAADASAGASDHDTTASDAPADTSATDTSAADTEPTSAAAANDPTTATHRDDDQRRSEWARRIAELANGTPLTLTQLAHLLDNADIERCVIAPNSRIIDISHRTRYFTGATRRAIEIRDRHCTHPTCNEPAHRCHVDHITPWSHGGPTTQDNGRLLCGPHNRARNHQRPPPQPPP